jgi:hypothetical protein
MQYNNMRRGSSLENNGFVCNVLLVKCFGTLKGETGQRKPWRGRIETRVTALPKCCQRTITTYVIVDSTQPVILHNNDNITAMATKSQRDYEKEVRSWGFPHVFTWTDSPLVYLDKDRIAEDRINSSRQRGSLQSTLSAGSHHTSDS